MKQTKPKLRTQLQAANDFMFTMLTKGLTCSNSLCGTHYTRFALRLHKNWHNFDNNATRKEYR